MYKFSDNTLICKRTIVHNVLYRSAVCLTKNKKYEIVNTCEEHFNNNKYGRVYEYVYVIKDDFGIEWEFYYNNLMLTNPYNYRQSNLKRHRLEDFFYTTKEYRELQLEKLI